MAFRLPPALGVILVALGTSSLAAADEPMAAQKETARALMDAGHACDDRGDHRAALDSFLAADALVHVPTTGFEVAGQQAALHMLVEARDTALRVVRLPAAPSEPLPFITARQRAQALADDLAPRIPSLQISVANAENIGRTQVSIDGAAVPVAALGVPFKVNPGHHVVSAVDGSLHAEREVDAAEGSVTPVALSLASPSQESHLESDAASPSASYAKALRWGGLGLAVAGVVAGTVSGVVSLSATSSAKQYCDGGRCGSASAGDLQSAETTATISDIGFATAGVGAVAFLLSFAFPTPKTSGRRAAANRGSAHAAPACAESSEMALAPRTRAPKSARRSLLALPFVLASAGGCAIVSGLNGLALDPQCTDSCAPDGGGAGPTDGSGASLPDRAPVPGPDAGTDASDSGTVTSDTGTDAGQDGGLAPGDIRCGSSGPCTAGTQECCMSSASTPALSCSSASDPNRCPGGTELKCDDRSDCSGNVCCIQLNASGYVLQTLCQSACSGTGWFELCGPGGTCGSGACSALTVLPNPPLTPPWFYACQ